MSVLFRLSEREEKGGAISLDEMEEYFKRQLPEENECYFNAKGEGKMRQLQKDDTIFFQYSGKLVAKAKYTGKFREYEKVNGNRYAHYGYKLYDIQWIESTPSIPKKLFSSPGAFIYPKDEDFEMLKKLSHQKLYPDDVDNKFPEGGRKKVFVNKYERKPEARETCVKLHGTICKVCGFDFEKVYGEIGKGFIHIHHIVPVSKMTAKYDVDPKTDLVPVCPNCHAMLHQKNGSEPYSIEEMKEIIEQNR